MNKQGYSIRATSKLFEVPYATLYARLNNTYGKSHGRPTVFSVEEEAILADSLMVLADWGFPLIGGEVRQLVAQHLKRLKRKEATFPNNIPGKDWLKLFMSRHPTLSERLC